MLMKVICSRRDKANPSFRYYGNSTRMTKVTVNGSLRAKRELGISITFFEMLYGDMKDQHYPPTVLFMYRA